MIITGCNGGIGSWLVKYFKEHYKIIGIDRGIPKCEPYKYIDYDLNNISCISKNLIPQVINIINSSKEIILINNAAIQITGSIDNILSDDLEKSFRVNVIAAFELTKNLIDFMKKSKSTVINIGSIHSKLTKKDFLPYSVSKSAVDGLTRAMSIEYNDIKVFGINPAAVETKMLKQGLKDKNIAIDELERYHPSNTIGKPIQVAQTINSLINMPSFATGAIVDIAGGIQYRLHDPG